LTFFILFKKLNFNFKINLYKKIKIELSNI